MTKPSQQAIHMLDLKLEITELRSELQAAIDRVLDSGSFITGTEVCAFESEVAEHLGVKHAIGLNSGTDALVIGLRALRIGPGDEVITTPFTFFATAEAIALVGATPVFVDIEYDSFNINPELIEQAITPSTKAIMPVHLYGRPASMARIMQIANAHSLFVIEDAAQSFGARSHDLPSAPYTGTIGEIGAFSFYPTKNLGAYGDAGMITTNDDDLAQLARKLRSHGSLKAYENEMIGYNSRLDEIQAAMLRVKLPHVERWNQQRRELAAAYQAELADVPGIEWPAIVDGHVFHQITVRVKRNRDELLNHLADSRIHSKIYYPRLASDLGEGNWSAGCTPISIMATLEVISLPLLRLGETHNFERVIEAVQRFR